jgi:prepilin-type processing-associated H-X9-DG protein
MAQRSITMLAIASSTIVYIVVAFILLLLVLSAVKTVPQGTVAVTTIFGKYHSVRRAGLNFLVPFVEKIFRRISIQNRAVELQFQAITQDQANVYFTAMMVYSVIAEDEVTVKNVAFKFVSEKDFLTAMVRSVEGSTRGFVATMRQAEILGLRGEIVKEVKENLDVTLETWGYHLIDLQLNDITFDQAITTSMAQVVASNNLKAAATNEGDALLIRKTKEAEAEGTSIRIAAEAERTAAQLRGQGVALFREEVARGLAQAARELENNNVDSALILFSMWTESIRHVAENGRGNVLFLDGSPEGMQKQFQDLMALQQLHFIQGEMPPLPPPKM